MKQALGGRSRAGKRSYVHSGRQEPPARAGGSLRRQRLRDISDSR